MKDKIQKVQSFKFQEKFPQCYMIFKKSLKLET